MVSVKIESLNDLSKPMLSKTKKLDKINKLKKKDINIRKEIFTFSSVILFSELKTYDEDLESIFLKITNDSNLGIN